MKHELHNPGGSGSRLLSSGASALALLVATLLAPPSAVAQDAGEDARPENRQELEEVVVVGIRKSLEKSIALKELNESIVEVATADICHQTNPRPCTREDFAQIFAAAI